MSEKMLSSYSVRDRFTRLEEQFPLPLLPALLTIGFMMAAPILYLVIVSVQTYDPINLYEPVLTTENYTRLILDPFYRSYVVYTVQVATAVTVICLLLGYPIGYKMAHTSQTYVGVLLFLTLLPLMVGVVVRTYGWMIILGRRGIINQYALFFRDEPVQLLNTTPAVVVGLVGVMVPFMALPVYTSIESIDTSLEDAARDLGANKLQAFTKITLPLSLSGVITGSIFCFTMTMASIITPRLLGGRQDVTIGSLMYEMAVNDLNWPFAAAIAVTIAGTVFSLLFGYIKLTDRYMGEHYD